jgi:hypothetical protein
MGARFGRRAGGSNESAAPREEEQGIQKARIEERARTPTRRDATASRASYSTSRPPGASENSGRRNYAPAGGGLGGVGEAASASGTGVR